MRREQNQFRIKCKKCNVEGVVKTEENDSLIKGFELEVTEMPNGFEYKNLDFKNGKVDFYHKLCGLKAEEF